MPIFEGDRAFLDAFRRGEASALERVFEHYVDKVAQLVQHGFMLKGPGQRVSGVAEPDHQRALIHDIFVRAFSESARLAFDGLRPYQPYLLRIAKNLMIDALRRKRPDVSLEEVTEEEIEDRDGRPWRSNGEAVDDLHWRALSQVARAWIAERSEEERRFIALRFAEDRAQREIAAEMGVTRGRVRKLERELQQGLRRHLKKKGFC